MNEQAGIAERIRSAYAGADLEAFGELLADDVQWGDDNHPNRCRSRQDVLSTFEGWVAAGVSADVVGVDTGPHGVLARLNIHWTDPSDKRRGSKFIHVFMTGEDGLVNEIRRYNDVRSARKAIS